MGRSFECSGVGAWNERRPQDKAIVEAIAGKSYGEWIEALRKVALRPSTPLSHRDGIWKVVARYEAWHVLGAKIFDEHLIRLKAAALRVLSEIDPKFTLPKDERFAADVHGKVLLHSTVLRDGLADALALLGTFRSALPSVSYRKAEEIAVVTVRELFHGADWMLWASLDRVMPLLAEAAPEQFIDAFDNALSQVPCPFDSLFSQEGDGVVGWNYTSGLLWALETLAWAPEYLTRVVVLLGELASRDPGGRWSNRPSASLTTILLPWMPQTTAPMEKRRAAVHALADETPDVAWKLLLSLLPDSHGTSSGSRRPRWRKFIPDVWSKGTTMKEFWEQSSIYADMAVNLAAGDLEKLTGIVAHLARLPASAHSRLLENFKADSVTKAPEQIRLRQKAQEIRRS
jgi:hypothetical protein